MKYTDDPTTHHHRPGPAPRRGTSRTGLNDSSARDNSLNRRPVGSYSGDDMAPLITNQRKSRPPDVSSAAGLPDYHRPNERGYPITTRRSGPSESAGFDYYVGYAPEHEQPLPYVEDLHISRFAIA